MGSLCLSLLGNHFPRIIIILSKSRNKMAYGKGPFCYCFAYAFLLFFDKWNISFRHFPAAASPLFAREKPERCLQLKRI